MARQRPPSDLQSLIEEITIDCYNEDEELMGFENAFDEQADFPCPGTVIGQEVTVLSVATKNGRRELLATCEHKGRRYEIALLDVQLRTDPATERLVAAYRYWASCR